MVDPVAELVAIERIKALKARYFRCLDTKDWAAWAEVFAEDAVLEFDLAVSTRGRDGRPAPRLVGRAAIVETVAGRNAASTTVHHGHTPEIAVLSETEARGIWAMEDIVEEDGVTIHGFGHYHETYRQAGGVWRIAIIHLTRTRLTQTMQGALVWG